MEHGNQIQFNFSKRGFVRLVSYLCALVLVLSAGAATGYTQAQSYRMMLENEYSQALTGLASNLTGISTTLNKGRYAFTPVQISGLAAQLWRDASSAKTSLAALPLGELHLDNTNRFLTQIGDYAMALSRKSVSGTGISEQEREQFAGMCDYGLSLSEHVYRMEQSVSEGQITMESIRREIESNEDGAPPEEGTAMAMFEELETAFADYPKLEYDGPFSDHILTREAVMLKNVPEVSADEAKQVAAKAAEVEFSTLQESGVENSTLPAYMFTGDGVWVNVTQNGGYVSSMIKSRLPGESQITAENALRAAKEYLSRIGMHLLTPTYHQIGDGVCTVNFAFLQGDTVIYPDLVKVEVALDNGEILGFDARGYLANHTQRQLETPAVTEQEARDMVGEHLQVEKVRQAVIPTPGRYEVLCYEVNTISENGEHVLIYINAQTGVEEQILLLTQDDGGTYVR